MAGTMSMSSQVYEYVTLGMTAYLLGSVPVALMLAALLKRTDLRTIGSGNLSVYNTMFNVGMVPGVLTIVWNGVLAVSTVVITKSWFPANDIALMVAIGGVTAGNMWQLFAKFRGSRGSTTMGWTLLVAAPLILVVLFGIWVSAVLILRRSVPATRLLHASIPVVFGVVEGSWTYAIGGAIIGGLLSLKFHMSGDDTVALGLYRRFGVNSRR